MSAVANLRVPPVGRQKESTQARSANPAVAITVPCYNEAGTIAKVVADFHAVLPGATIYVYDNNSTDDTAARAQAAGAIVRKEPLQGKGNVVRRMFADIDADVYVLVDGDSTYDAKAAPALVEQLVTEGLDMVNAQRVADSGDGKVFPPGHRLGNWILSTMVTTIFGNRLTDTLSGYRVFSRRFVKSFPCLAHGFEIEVELTVHALELCMPIKEARTHYGCRPSGSTSKLHTVRDGFRVLGTIVRLIKNERPLWFFASLFAALATCSIALSVPIVATWRETGLVPRLPTAVLATGMMLLAFLSFACGLILETVTRGRREIKRMQYLSIPLFWRHSR
jgi:glycosyltransferase involved in cell wall biosynthesis